MHLYVGVCAFMCMCAVCIRMCVHIRMCMCAVCIRMCVHIRMCMCMCAYAFDNYLAM